MAEKEVKDGANGAQQGTPNGAAQTRDTHSGQEENIKEPRGIVQTEEPSEDNPLIITKGDKALKAIEKAKQKVMLLKEIKQIALTYLTERDIIDYDGNPYLEIDASMRVGQIFGVSFFDMRQDEIAKLKDDLGEYLIVRAYGKAEFCGTTVEDVGVVSTRDEFLGRAGGAWKPLAEVDITDVQKKAVTNLQNRLLKKVLGLKFSWEEITRAGLKRENMQVVRHGRGQSKAMATPEEVEKQKHLGKMIMELCEGDLEKAGKYLEKISSFKSKKDGKIVAGFKSCKDLTGKRLDITTDIVSKEYQDKFKKETKKPEAK